MNPSNTILLVEDSPEDAELTLREFRNGNVSNEIVVVRDGVEALDYLIGTATQEPQALPELILLDLKLPKIGGLALLRRLRAEERTRHVPVIVLTSSNEVKDILSSYDLGANSFVRKPVNLVQLILATKELGLRWLVLNNPPAE
jgi:two-component system response regulator